MQRSTPQWHQWPRLGARHQGLSPDSQHKQQAPSPEPSPAVSGHRGCWEPAHGAFLYKHHLHHSFVLYVYNKVWQIWRYSREFVEKYTANFILITNSVLNPHTFFRNTFHDLPYRSLRVLRLCLQMSPLDFDIKLIKSKHSKAGHWPSG